jgi:hypothetical protein
VPAIPTIHFARRRDIGTIRTIPKRDGAIDQRPLCDRGTAHLVLAAAALAMGLASGNKYLAKNNKSSDRAKWEIWTAPGLGLELPIIGKLLACMMQHAIDGKCHERRCRVARIDRPE